MHFWATVGRGVLQDHENKDSRPSAIFFIFFFFLINRTQLSSKNYLFLNKCCMSGKLIAYIFHKVVATFYLLLMNHFPLFATVTIKSEKPPFSLLNAETHFSTKLCRAYQYKLYPKNRVKRIKTT